MGKLKGYITSEKPIIAFHELLEKSYPLKTTPLKYEYLNVLDKNADSRDTIVEVVSRLYHEFKGTGSPYKLKVYYLYHNSGHCTHNPVNWL